MQRGPFIGCDHLNGHANRALCGLPKNRAQAVLRRAMNLSPIEASATAAVHVCSRTPRIPKNSEKNQIRLFSSTASLEKPLGMPSTPDDDLSRSGTMEMIPYAKRNRSSVATNHRFVDLPTPQLGGHAAALPRLEILYLCAITPTPTSPRLSLSFPSALFLSHPFVCSLMMPKDNSCVVKGAQCGWRPVAKRQIMKSVRCGGPFRNIKKTLV